AAQKTASRAQVPPEHAALGRSRSLPRALQRDRVALGFARAPAVESAAARPADIPDARRHARACSDTDAVAGHRGETRYREVVERYHRPRGGEADPGWRGLSGAA